MHYSGNIATTTAAAAATTTAAAAAISNEKPLFRQYSCNGSENSNLPWDDYCTYSNPPNRRTQPKPPST
ncbi:hypothetical protein L484_004444 [Morus notabilis]|uniref:Uncharacterized protein n=1 Tax=Morus notabilis TaxID=981085 RepID=W9S5F3_9ROSA|nr:hypothetical protein L484_004444 [Morus notabilis]